MSDPTYMNDMARGSGSNGVPLAGFLLGAIFGAGLALLLAPAPGGETRRRLGETARRLGNAASEAVRHARESESDGGSHQAGGGPGGETQRGPRSSREPLAGAPGTTS